MLQWLVWVVGSLYVLYTQHGNGSAAHKKLSCGFLATSRNFWGGDFLPIPPNLQNSGVVVTLKRATKLCGFSVARSVARDTKTRCRHCK